jgi:hypothetical protein
MSRIHVRELALKVPDNGLIDAARDVIEEALRLTAIGFEPHFILIRRLQLGRLPAALRRNRNAIAALVAERLRQTVAGAAVFTDPRAPAAEAVIAGHPQEIRAALAVRLLAGESPPSGWFWSRAVPEWGCDAASLPLLRVLTTDAEGRVALSAAVARQTRSSAQMAHSAMPHMTASLASELLALWPGIRITDPEEFRGDARAIWFRIQGIVAVAPQFATQGIVIRRKLTLVPLGIEQAWSQHSVQAEYAAAPGRKAGLTIPHQHVRTGTSPLPLEMTPREPEASADPAIRTPKAIVQRAPDHLASPTTAARPIPGTETRPVSAASEVFSHHAGLLLLIRPLERLGLPRWLEARGDATAAGFGWLLLDSIADRQKILADDPVRTLLRIQIDPPDLSDELRLWRVALDRMLRRRTRSGLASTVRRKGWVCGGDSWVAARFPEASATTGLRRMGFDLDPGFVPWLGVRVTYRYEDRRPP